jgi:hypothetical protein
LLLALRTPGFLPLSFLVAALLLLLLLNIGLATLCGRAAPWLLTAIFPALATLLHIFRGCFWRFSLLWLHVRPL